jgi:hypothetical protein
MPNFGFSQRKQHVSLENNDLLMFHRKMIGIDFENYKKDITYDAV